MSGTEQGTEAGRRSRPGGRASQVVAAIHAATLEILQEGGYEKLELPEVAARAGVNKTTVYRRWPSKGELVLEIALLRMRRDVPVPDTGTLQGDLCMLMLAIATTLRSPLIAGLLQAIVTHGNTTEALKHARVQFWTQRFSISGELVTRAIERGELPAGTSPRQMLELACSPLFFRSVVTGEAFTTDEIVEIARRTILAFKSA